MRTHTRFPRLTHVLRPGFFAFVGFFVMALLIGLSGCGGGGNGTNGGTGGCANRPSSLNYTTVWSDLVGSGQSQVVSIVNGDGDVLANRLLNKGTVSATLSGFTSGTYEVRIDLYSGLDAAGAKIGEVITVMEFCGTSSFGTTVAGTIDGVEVRPASATFTVQQTVQFRAYLKSGSRALFSDRSDFEWESIGGVATIDSNGLAVGTQVGDGTIRARYTTNGDVGGAAISVRPFQTTRAKWGVFVFLNAANDLYEFSDLNVNQMESVAYNPDVRFVVQWKQSRAAWPNSSFDGTRRMVIKYDTSNSIVSPVVQNMGPNVDMGSPLTLRNFITWAKTFYPADRYCLVVWNHGNGWRRKPGDFSARAFSYDDDTGNAIQIWDLQQALANDRFDIFAWDCSLMQMLECAYQLRTNTDFVVGSEESPPGEGYPYQLIFKRFADNPNDTTKNLTKAFVDGMVNNPPYANRKITQSVLDTSKLGDLAASLDAYAGALIANQAVIGTQVQYARNNAQSYSPTAGRTYRDLIDLTLKLEAAPGGVPSALVTAGMSLRSAASAAIAWEGHNNQSPQSRGVAIDFSAANRFVNIADDYALLQLAVDTRWNEWLLVAP
ncbi:MAG TPA: clostripain-related cysteine peptidase [Fimbriimonadaceae bacterium]|nr:clostripain-related cysteine peptidase [Fimbriimonadaceae bacterium]HRJ96169.1 clostripain-related cysteine peptidase [Fimbriimonadaceae bacterium]